VAAAVAPHAVAEAEAPATPAPTQYAAAWTPAPSDELTLRVINETARSVCQSEDRARRIAQQNEAARRSSRRANKPTSCQSRPTLLTATVSGRPAES
jgi:hypothetical protein